MRIRNPFKKNTYVDPFEEGHKLAAEAIGIVDEVTGKLRAANEHLQHAVTHAEDTIEWAKATIEDATTKKDAAQAKQTKNETIAQRFDALTADA